MKVWRLLRENAKPAVIIVLLTGTIVWAQSSHFRQPASASAYLLGSSGGPYDSILSSVSIGIDSLGYDAVTLVGLWTPPVDVTVLSWQALFMDTVGAAGDTATIFLRSGTALTIKSIFVRYGQKSASSTTRFDITKLTPCSLFVSDSIVTSLSTTAAEHARRGNVIVNYTPNAP